MAVTVAVSLAASSAAAHADTYVANRHGDHAPNGCSGGDCTLREAILDANAHPGDDKVVLDGGWIHTLSIPGIGEDEAETGDLDVNDSLTIVSDKRFPAIINANSIDRVFDTGPLSAANVRFRRLRIYGGRITSGSAGDAFAGGGIRAGPGTVELLHTRLNDNDATFGAGLATLTFNKTTIVESAIKGNGAVIGCCADAGGGIVVSGATARARVVRSTIGNNTAHVGGGIASLSGGSMTAVNSTITTNTATANGGGVMAFSSSGPLSLSSVTIARNTADSDNAGTGCDGFGADGGCGGGIRTNGNPGPTVKVRNSIVTLNSVGTNGDGPDCSTPSSFTSRGVNLFTDLSGCSGFATPRNLLTSNPRLGDLERNGGPTKTIALKRRSPAVNEAGGGAPNRDQRGVKRFNPDIGAYERR